MAPLDDDLNTLEEFNQVLANEAMDWVERVNTHVPEKICDCVNGNCFSKETCYCLSLPFPQDCHRSCSCTLESCGNRPTKTCQCILGCDQVDLCACFNRGSFCSRLCTCKNCRNMLKWTTKNPRSQANRRPFLDWETRVLQPYKSDGEIDEFAIDEVGAEQLYRDELAMAIYDSDESQSVLDSDSTYSPDESESTE